MPIQRRNFIRSSLLAGAGMFVIPFHPEIYTGKIKKFPGQIGVCTGFSNSNIIMKAGYSYIEESVQSFLDPLNDESLFLQKLEQVKKSGIKIPACNVFIPGKLKSVGPDAVPDDILKYAETAFRRAAMAGVKIIVFGSGGSRSIPDGFSRGRAREQFINLCSSMAPIARKYDIVVVLEPLNSGECNFLNSVAEGGEMVMEINHPNIRLLADIFHMLREKESPESIVKYGRFIHHTHIAENIERSAPGVNREDFTPYFKALLEINYKGLMSVECNWKNLPDQAAGALQYIRLFSQLNGSDK